MPLLNEIDRVAEEGLTDTNAHAFLAARLSGENDKEQLWRVVKQWLVFFFPNTYRLETGQDVLVKGKVLPRRWPVDAPGKEPDKSDGCESDMAMPGSLG